MTLPFLLSFSFFFFFVANQMWWIRPLCFKDILYGPFLVFWCYFQNFSFYKHKTMLSGFRNCCCLKPVMRIFILCFFCINMVEWQTAECKFKNKKSCILMYTGSVTQYCIFDTWTRLKDFVHKFMILSHL